MREPRDALLSLQRIIAGVLPEPWDIRLDMDGEPPERPYVLIEQAGDEVTSGPPVSQEVAIPVTVNCYLEAQSTRKEATQAALDLREVIWQRVKWGEPPWSRLTTDRLELYDYRGRDEVQRIRIKNANGGTFTLSLDSDETDAIDWDVDREALLAELQTLVGVDNVAVVRRADRIFDVVFIGDLATTPVGELVADGDDLLPSTAAVTVKTLLHGAEPPVRGPSDYMRVASFHQNTIRDDDDPRIVMVAVDLRLTFARGAPVPLGQTILQRIDVEDPDPERL